MAMIKGEGDTRIVVKTRVRKTCECCGEPATKRITFLAPNARRNPASSAYGGDDVSWCSDHEAMRCDEHKSNQDGVPEGFGFCAEFTASDRFAHMFLEWEERAFDPALLPA